MTGWKTGSGMAAAITLAVTALAVLLACHSHVAHAGSPTRLSLPIDCELGTSCFIENRVDIDAGPAARDSSCGTTTYDGSQGRRLPTFIR